ncbi:MAG: recombinase XerC, partial [Comamonadaceae bacterium]
MATSDPGDALIDRYLEHVRVERRLAARTVELYAIHLAEL